MTKETEMEVKRDIFEKKREKAVDDLGIALNRAKVAKFLHILEAGTLAG